MLVRAWEVRGLKPSERLVLLALADCADREGCNAFRSQASIAEHTQLDLRTVKRAVKALTDERLISIQEAKRQHRPTTYRLFASGGKAPPLAVSGRGDNLSPLRRSVVTSVVTNPQSSGDIARRASLDPLLDPGDPPRADARDAERWLQKLSDQVHYLLQANPAQDSESLYERLSALAIEHELPHTPDTLTRAIRQALGQRERSAAMGRRRKVRSA